MNTRILFAVVLALSAMTARSQNAELTNREAIIEWLKLSAISDGETDEASMAHLVSHGLSEDAAAALAAYMKKAEAEYNAFAATFQTNLCANQQALRDGGQEALAQFIESHTARENAMQRAQVLAAEALLSDVDKIRLHNLLDCAHGPKVHLEDNPDTSVANQARTGQITVEDAIKRSNCGSVQEKQ